ncbi:MAG: hypothetical protein GKR98_06620 [Boseongicola sp.]|nr:MAG: hypothetical protein GKR98_06620 [Boseongicola sp.]
MSDHHWRNGLATGLTIGIIGILAVGVVVGQVPDGMPSDAAGGDKSGINSPADHRWWLIPRVLYMEDTAAQWVMMIATIVAAYLLLRTLWATQEMAKEAKRIGEAQTRAYVDVIKVVLYLDQTVPDIIITVKNSGVGPAKWFELSVETDVQETLNDGSLAEIVSKSPEKMPARWPGLGGGEEVTCRGGFGGDSAAQITLVSQFPNVIEHALICRGVLRYRTFFNETFESEFIFVLRPIPKPSYEPVVSINEPNVAGLARRVENRIEIPAIFSKSRAKVRTYERVDRND